MSQAPEGIRIKLSPARKLSIELLHHARLVPTVPVARSLDVAAIAAARECAEPAPSWTTIFVRAYGLVCQQFPQLRRVLMPWPFAHLYEHPHSTCALIVERFWADEHILLGAKIRAPEDRSLPSIQQAIRRFKEAPIEQIGDFRRALTFGRLPWLLRRFAFWQTLYLSGYKRAKRFGTFMVSSYGSLGAEQIHPLAPFTTLFTFGPIASSGAVVVKIIYDHRVLDGACVARCLNYLDEVLQTKILAELRMLERKAA